MKAYQHELTHAYDRWRSRFRSASFFHSLIIATVVGVLVASVGIALFALYWGHWASGHSHRLATDRP